MPISNNSVNIKLKSNMELKYILTFDNGIKETVKIISKGKPIFFKQLEENLVDDFNRMLANTPNRVIKGHLMRN